MRDQSIMRGMTLIEVVVVMMIVGLIAGIAVLALPRVVAVATDDPGRVLAEARRRALLQGKAQTARLLIDSAAHEVVVLPDGSVIADRSVALDRLTARWRHAP